jgi:hypothetical protein
MTDPWWNPAIGEYRPALRFFRLLLSELNPEDQAFDRAHRLGQTRDVHIYKLMVPDTVEERILEVCCARSHGARADDYPQLQEKKRALAKAALEGGKVARQNKLGFNELLNLFRHGHHEED